LSNATQAEEKMMKPDPCVDKNEMRNCGKDLQEGMETIKGEVLRVESDNYLIQRFDGREVRLHTDANTETTGMISRGDRIEAQVQEVDDQKHVRSIRQTK
jgi:hypothetical protein